MGSRDKFFGINTLTHGFDDIGTEQASGAISSVARYGGSGKWRKCALVTASAAHGLTDGRGINIVGTTDYDGPTIVLKVVSSTKFLIKRAFTITTTGSWNCLGAEGNWDAIMPIGTDVNATGIASLYQWRPNMGGYTTAIAFTKDKVYPYPGGIRRILLGSAASYNLRLFRASSLRPGGVKGLIPPLVVGYNPTGATAGDSVDILGSYFDPALSNNSVKFVSGGTSVIVNPTAIDPEGHWMTVPFPSGVVSTTGAFTVKTNGLATATGPSFNVR